MEYNYSKLKGKIKEVCGTQGVFAVGMRLSENSISQKLNNESEWSQIEMEAAMKILGLNKGDIVEYFFSI